MSDRHSLHISLHGMTPVECNKIILSTHHIQTCRSKFLHRNTSVTGIYNFNTAGDNIIFRKHTVKQHRLYSGHTVFQNHLKGLSFIIIRIHRRKSFQSIFPVAYAVTLISEITAVGAVRIFNNTCRSAVVPCPQRRKFLRQ